MLKVSFITLGLCLLVVACSSQPQDKLVILTGSESPREAISPSEPNPIQESVNREIQTEPSQFNDRSENQQEAALDAGEVEQEVTRPEPSTEAGVEGLTQPETTQEAEPKDSTTVQDSTPAKCPPGMVYIPFVNPSTKASQPFCIDAYEVTVVEKRNGQETGNQYSPYYPPDPSDAAKRYASWETLRKTMGSPQAQKVPLPPLPTWYTNATSQSLPAAKSVGNVVPHGYLSGLWAEKICRNAGKRLCSRLEWKFACRGPKNLQFPYGDGKKYIWGECNVHRREHPAVILHNSASRGHSDPRLNQTKDKNGKPLLRKTGATLSCVVEWPDGKLYDMVGNLDEWTSDRRGVYGTFVGGFFSRVTTRGCESVISGHGYVYSDYSLGTRCCAPPH